MFQSNSMKFEYSYKFFQQMLKEDMWTTNKDRFVSFVQKKSIKKKKKNKKRSKK